MFIVTTETVPGHRITSVLGQVLGTIVRTSSPGEGWNAGLQTLGGGEVQPYTRLFWEMRQEAMNRMWAAAAERGANAVIGMRYDSNDLGSLTGEMCAYGTAVVIEPLGGEGAAASGV